MLTGKRCPGCGQTKPPSDFYKRKRSTDGLQAYCKQCSLKSVKEYQGRIGKSIVHRSSKYGLTEDEVRIMLEIPVCQACGALFSDSFAMKFDHCHQEGHFRGVLCHPCNMACQGPSREASERLTKAVEYLRRDMERQHGQG